MELSAEDSLRLNVLLANAEAIRIDENNMVVYGLRDEQEMKAPLNPTCRKDKYLTMVRELLSSTVLDSPGGYPVFLRRWTRMGQIDNEQMDRLLKLGEEEAVMAVVCSPGITDELARKAWWAAPYSEHARHMLARAQIVQGRMGRVLAEHLIEHLPFETEHLDMLETVRLVLQPGLINEEQRARLWSSSRKKKTYKVGFLSSTPDELPEKTATHPHMDRHQSSLQKLEKEDNIYAAMLLRLLQAEGQRFLEVAEEAMEKPADQDVVSALFNAIGQYFSSVYVGDEPLRDIDRITQHIEQIVSQDAAHLAQIRQRVPELEAELRAMLILAQVQEALVTPVFAVSDAVGSVMRKKIQPITEELRQQMHILRGR